MPVDPQTGAPLPYPEDQAQGGGLPPEIMALLGGAGAGDVAAPPEVEEESLDWGARLHRMISDARAVTEEGGVSEKERLLLEKVTTMIQQIRAEREKEQDGLIQGKMSPGALRRAVGG